MARLMVLGLLQMKPMTGYEIQQIMQTSKTDLWAGILPGSIYHALKKMEKEGLVEIEEVKQTGHRSKAIYKITEHGELEFLKMVSDSLSNPSVILPSELYTALSFTRHLPNDTVIHSLKKQKEIIEQGLATQKNGMDKKREAIGILDPLSELTAQNIYNQYELQIDFIQKLINFYEVK
ncbi:PadR family transcriptional regulator [Cytobacillus purgationiresistens]|uniref:DNA-binding PadR family transcriptional regulator n=1 Tax=Cytobacillus purgationiresistens TaxID=863449 RepID=A0ABU0ACT5_9BACI|nr:PadR family transcriptional regulator [Cytobacillus purgationiresistens]MDQ0269067.1 DNA-binding PadR family transcriptional regulator [Cytobacillus purgationiresistens]